LSARQTADTFLAAATFLELLHIWGTVDPDITSKIIYAKFHALRIAKALNAGEDPNLSNPVPESEPTEGEALPALDPNDADVQMLNGAGDGRRQPAVVEVPDEAHRIQRNLAQKSSLDESLHPSRAPSVPRSGETKPRQPSVVEVPDEAHRLQSNMALQSSLDESLHPSRAPSIPPALASRDVSPPAPNDPANYYTNNTNEPDVSPIAPEPPTTDRKPSTGGNYFPRVPSPFAQPPPASVDIPSAPIDADSVDLPNAPSERSLPDAPSALASVSPFPPPQRRESPKFPPTHHGHFLPQGDTIPPNFAPQSTPKQPILQAPPQLRQQPVAPPQYAAAPTAPAPPADVVVDEEAVMKAQKHARWAISALNFEDVPTAIKELRGALETLGAR
jgi:vacuolar protein sorting-associated protein VTA1